MGRPVRWCAGTAHDTRGRCPTSRNGADGTTGFPRAHSRACQEMAWVDLQIALAAPSSVDVAVITASWTEVLAP